MLANYLDSVLRLPEDNVPTVTLPSDREGIERAAERCRLKWGLGLDLPLTHTIRALERAGVIVSVAKIDSDKIDGFSKSYGKRSVVVLGTDKNNPCRRRYDVAHEAGHLAMHVGIETGTPEREDEANVFASAFLLPRVGFVREFPRPPSGNWGPSYWRHLFDLKQRWAASAGAIIRRAFDLRLIDAIQYQKAYKYMSAKGWLRNGEPAATEPAIELPELLPNAFAVLKQRRGVGALDVCRTLHWRPETLEVVAGIKVERPKVNDDRTPADVIPIARSSKYKPQEPVELAAPRLTPKGD